MSKLKRGESPLAQPGWDKWKGKKRPRGWRGGVWGVVVHTTGAKLPARALENEERVICRAHGHYLKTHGTNYVIDYDGGIIQVANEDMQANGVGMSDQIAMIKQCSAGSWANKSFNGSVVAHARWAGRWASPEIGTPLDLYPSKFANSCYVHVEMPPCVFWYNNKMHEHAEPHRPGLRFTTAQHDAVVKLCLDIADRNKFPEGWWKKTGRLVGHEDLSPITRGTKDGCWDPGWLRENPWFDCLYIKEALEKEYKKRAAALLDLEEATEAVRCESAGPAPEETVAQAFVEWVQRLLVIFARKRK